MSEIHDVLKREIKVLTFDQYGTIVDIQKGLTEAVTPFLKQKGWDGKPNNFVTWWRRTHFENSMIDALCEVSWLVSEIEKLKPFPDVVAALEKLRSKGYKLTILSNGDRDMLKAAGPHIGFAFDHVVSVQEPAISNRTGRPMRKPRRSLGATAPASCLLPIMPSIALAQNLTACGPRSSTAASGRLAKHPISLIS
jgi:FMN phosphatase YigB (HAD superfamily)